MKKILFALVVLSALFVQPAYAVLVVDVGGMTVTETRSDGSKLMWLKDANTPKTTGYDTGSTEWYAALGIMNWYAADAWVDGLNNNNYLGYSDWRLPKILPVNGSSYQDFYTYDGTSDWGWNNQSLGSELSYMFYVELGNIGIYDTAGHSQPGGGLVHTGPFDNFGNGYWSSSIYQQGVPGAQDSHRAWDLNMGFQGAGGDLQAVMFATAVRDWTEPTAIPEPSTILLLSLGGFAMAAMKRRKNVAK